MALLIPDEKGLECFAMKKVSLVQNGTGQYPRPVAQPSAEGDPLKQFVFFNTLKYYCLIKAIH